MKEHKINTKHFYWHLLLKENKTLPKCIFKWINDFPLLNNVDETFWSDRHKSYEKLVIDTTVKIFHYKTIHGVIACKNGICLEDKGKP